MKILYAEDGVAMRSIIEKLLHNAGHEVHVFPDGEGITEYLGASLYCDLVLTDNQMPYVTGLEVLRWIRMDTRSLGSLPVIVLSGDDSIESTVIGLNGIFMAKDSPGLADRLLKKISELIV